MFLMQTLVHRLHLRELQLYTFYDVELRTCGKHPVLDFLTSFHPKTSVNYGIYLQQYLKHYLPLVFYQIVIVGQT